MIKLDYKLETLQERQALVKAILEEQPNPSKKYLEILGDYLCDCMSKEEKKEKKILTENRLATVNKRETSLEGLVSKFEYGEDGIYNMLDSNGKSTIFKPKISITEKDLEEIPELSQTTAAIEYWTKVLSNVSGKQAFIAKKALIEARKDQYVIKDAFRKPTSPLQITHSKHDIKLPSKEWVDAEGNTHYEGVSLMNPTVCSAILCNYEKLKNKSWGAFEEDTWYLIDEFDSIKTKALESHPIYNRIVELKIYGSQNIDIQETLEKEFDLTYSLEYISSLWRKKIPELIASTAEDNFLDYWYLNVEKGKYKRCSRCGKIKLANNKYFSKNKTSKDGFYSICKECRNKKVK